MSESVELNGIDLTEALSLLVAGLLGLSALLVSVASHTGFELIELFQIFGTLGSLLLSGLLVLFYSRMSEIQATQAETQRQQVDLQKQQQRIEFSSYLEIEDYRVEGDQVYLDVSNLGRGKAQNLGISFDVSKPESLAAETEPIPVDTRFSGEQLNKSKTTIAPGESSVSLTAIPAVELDKGSHKSAMRFNDLLRDIDEEEVDDYLWADLFLHYDDFGEDKEPKQINQLPIQAYLPEASSLEDADPKSPIQPK